MADEAKEVVAVARTLVEIDGSSLEVHFKIKNGPTVGLRFAVDLLTRVAVQITQLAISAQIRRAAGSGHLATPTAAAVAVSAQAPVGGGNVILSIRIGNGLLQDFSLSPDQTKTLLAELQNAEVAARLEAAKTRQ